MASLEFYTDNTLEILPESEIVAVVDAANSTRTFPFRLSEQPFLASRQTYWRNFSEQVSYLEPVWLCRFDCILFKTQFTAVWLRKKLIYCSLDPTEFLR